MQGLEQNTNNADIKQTACHGHCETIWLFIERRVDNASTYISGEALLDPDLIVRGNIG